MPFGHDPARPATSIVLRALDGEPLADKRIRELVIAAARGLAERHGVELLDITAEGDRLTCVLAADRIVAMGFAAELRRTTDAWHAHKFNGATLWGDPRRDEAEEREPWSET